MIFGTFPYGWGAVYLLTVEGIPTVFAERATGLTLPGSGPFSSITAEDGSLVIDDSGPIGSSIDRLRGIGTGLSLGFALLDTAAVRAALLAPQYTARLAADVTATATTITVDDTSSWPASGEFWCGVERITYAGKTATTFTGCTRAAKPYAHSTGSASGIVTSAPRWWIGREVTLWALAVDPAGIIPGSTLGDVGNVDCLWRGYIEDGPQRIAGGFRFEASSLERRLDRGFQAAISGKVVSTEARYKVDPQTIYGVTVYGLGAAGLVFSEDYSVQPYIALSAGQTYSGAELRQATVAAFNAAIGVGAQVTGFAWVQVGKYYQLQIQVAPQTYNVKVLVIATGSNPGFGSYEFAPGAGLPVIVNTSWATWGNPDQLVSAVSATGIYGMSIELDEGLASIVQAPATVELEDIGTVVAATVEAVDGLLYVGQFTSADVQLATVDAIGSTATVKLTAPGTPADTLIQHLVSSGTAGLRDAIYDVLPRAQGYGLDASRVDKASISALFSQGWLSLWSAEVETGDKSAADLFGGCAALTGLALVARPDRSDQYRQVKIACVAAVLGSSGASVEITDTDLLALVDSPVEVLDRARPVNLIKLELGGDRTITFTDQAAADTVGTNEQSYTIPSSDRDAIRAAATPQVLAYFLVQPSIQTIAIRVGPQVDAQVGDSIWLNISHPSIYDWQTGASGYFGSALVLGREFDLRTSTVRLTVAASASVQVRALSPSALVTAASLPGAYLEVDRGWYGHFAKTYEVDGAFSVIMYDPGDVESSTNTATISAVIDTGTACRLSVSAFSGALSPTPGTTRLTLPETANATNYQQQFAHVDDGGAWT